MARPTKAEQERRRIAELLAEGKGPDGQPISEGEIISETKNPPKEEDKTGGFSIAELDQEIESSTLGKGGANTTENTTSNTFDINTGDAKMSDEDDPNYVKPSGHDRFRESIIENESDANKAAINNPDLDSSGLGNGGGGNPPPQKDFAEPVINASTTPNPEEEKKKDEPISDDFDKMSPTQKREQVEMFADAILTNYAQLSHAAFSGLCSIKMNKMEILDKNGEIRLSMAIEQDEEGKKTVRQIFLKYNEDVNEAFIITPEQIEQLRGPLIAVMMEKGLAPSPMTTLLIVFGGQVLQNIFKTAQFKSQVSELIESIKDLTKAEKEREIATHKAQQYSGPAVVRNETTTPPPAEKKEAVVVSMEEVMKTEIKPVEIKSEKNVTTTSENNSGITIEDVVG